MNWEPKIYSIAQKKVNIMSDSYFVSEYIVLYTVKQ